MNCSELNDAFQQNLPLAGILAIGALVFAGILVGAVFDKDTDVDDTSFGFFFIFCTLAMISCAIVSLYFALQLPVPYSEDYDRAISYLTETCRHRENYASSYLYSSRDTYRLAAAVTYGIIIVFALWAAVRFYRKDYGDFTVERILKRFVISGMISAIVSAGLFAAGIIEVVTIAKISLGGLLVLTVTMMNF